MAALNLVLPPLIDQMRLEGTLTAERRREFAAYAAQAGRICCRDRQFASGMALMRLGFELDRRAADRAIYSWPSWILRTAFGPAFVERLSVARRFLKRSGRNSPTGPGIRKDLPVCAE